MKSTAEAFFATRPLWVSVPSIVAVSVLASLSAMFLLIELLDHGYGPTFRRSLTIAIVAPVLVSAPIGGYIVHLLREADRARSQAQVLAWHDELTGLLNRRRFCELGREALAGAQQHTGLPWAAVIDIDDFKHFNDRHGHGVGDELLRAVGQALKREARSGDLVARWGGEEFVVLMQAAGAEQAEARAERMRLAVKALRVPMPKGGSVSCTVSVGATEAAAGEPFEAFIDRADQAMYGAKLDGKDRTLLLTRD